jgi:hypothetical protein
MFFLERWKYSLGLRNENVIQFRMCSESLRVPIVLRSWISLYSHKCMCFLLVFKREQPLSSCALLLLRRAWRLLRKESQWETGIGLMLSWVADTVFTKGFAVTCPWRNTPQSLCSTQGSKHPQRVSLHWKLHRSYLLFRNVVTTRLTLTILLAKFTEGLCFVVSFSQH